MSRLCEQSSTSWATVLRGFSSRIDRVINYLCRMIAHRLIDAKVTCARVCVREGSTVTALGQGTELLEVDVTDPGVYRDWIFGGGWSFSTSWLDGRWASDDVSRCAEVALRTVDDAGRARRMFYTLTWLADWIKSTR